MTVVAAPRYPKLPHPRWRVPLLLGDLYQTLCGIPTES
jgi:hypothetical protein